MSHPETYKRESEQDKMAEPDVGADNFSLQERMDALVNQLQEAETRPCEAEALSGLLKEARGVLAKSGKALQRLSRAFRAISECNQAVIRADDEAALLSEVCRIIQTVGGYCMVWVGFKEEDAGQRVRPVAQAGFEAGYLEKAGITWSDGPRGRGPTGRAVREGRPAICRNILNDPSLLPWREDALARGYGSSIGLPLSAEGKILGALTLYAVDTDAFDGEEVSLLSKLAGDLAFGIMALRETEARRWAEEELRRSRDFLEESVRQRTAQLARSNEALRESERRYKTLVESAPDAIGVCREGAWHFLNWAGLGLLGASHISQVVGTPFLDWVHAGDRDGVRERMYRAERGLLETDNRDVRMVRLDGEVVHVSARETAIMHEGQRAVQIMLKDITARKHAEAKLEEAGRLLDALMEHVPEGITVADARDMAVQRVSRYGLELLGSLQEGATATEIAKARAVYQSDGITPMAETDIPLVRAILKGEAVRDVEMVQVGASGQPLPLLCNAAPIRDGEGTIVGGVVAWRDISELKRAEKALREREARYRALVLQSPEAIYVNRGNRVVFANPAACRLFGASAPGQLLGRSPLDLFDPRCRAQVRERIERLLQGHPVPLVQETVLRLDGTVRDVEVAASPFTDEEGIAIQVTLRDITERKLLQAQLEAERARWHAMVESMLDPVTVCDELGQAVYMNPAYERMIGMTIKSSLPMEDHPAHFQIFHPDGRLFAPEDLPLQRAALRGEEVRNEEIVQRDAGGQDRILVINAAPLRDASGRITGAVASGRDITEQRRVEADRVRLLEKVETLAAKAEKHADELDAVFAAITDAVMVYDAQGTPIRANPAALQDLGLDPVAMDPKEVASKVYVVDAVGNPIGAHEFPFQLSRQGARPGQQRYVLTNALGRELVILASAEPLFTGGKLAGRVVFWHDITDQERAGNALRRALIRAKEREAQISALLTSARAVLETNVFEEAAEVIYSSLKELAGAPMGVFGVVQEGRRDLGFIVEDLGEGPLPREAGAASALKDLCEEACRAGKAALRRGPPPGAEGAPQGHDSLGLLQTSLLAPMMIEDTCAGILGLFGKQGGFSESDARMATAFAEIASIALKSTRAHEQIAASLREKEVLLKEIHHRVKNNLQIVASMLNLQAGAIKDEATRAPLMESQNRVRTLALLHEKLYGSRDLSRIPFGDYLMDLAKSLASSFGAQAKGVSFRFDLDEVRLGIGTAIPVALITNELLSNAFKYAFPPGRPGRIAIVLRTAGGGMFELAVEDDGVGFPEGLDYEHTESLGLQLVCILAKQLGGSLDVRRRGGTRFALTFEERA